ncbi:uncharacterized protein LOC100904471 [Galendromus occidentalis]|uniref:Uncharacterized protein LOC100904471 n=1 Tax=Galendromus occidentalis TaxID=34638 RepID=A0AAJ6QUH3_9ACAR|nr:uncharacterized protein LOC100904471 [Galendromus occidentalis]
MSNPSESVAGTYPQKESSLTDHDDLHSLTQLVDHPKKLHKTLFKLIDKKEVKKMLPPSLKKLKSSAIRELCLQKLEQVSKESIVRMIVGEQSLGPSREADQDDRAKSRRSRESQSPLHSAKSRSGNKSEISKSTLRDGANNHSARSKSPSRTLALGTNDSPASSSWTSGSGNRRWSRTPSVERTSFETSQTQSNTALDRTVASNGEASPTRLEDMDTDELELRARALRSLSNRLDRLQGRAPQRDSPH